MGSSIPRPSGPTRAKCPANRHGYDPLRGDHPRDSLLGQPRRDPLDACGLPALRRGARRRAEDARGEGRTSRRASPSSIAAHNEEGGDRAARREPARAGLPGLGSRSSSPRTRPPTAWTHSSSGSPSGTAACGSSAARAGARWRPRTRPSARWKPRSSPSPMRARSGSRMPSGSSSAASLTRRSGTSPARSPSASPRGRTAKGSTGATSSGSAGASRRPARSRAGTAPSTPCAGPTTSRSTRASDTISPSPT